MRLCFSYRGDVTSVEDWIARSWERFKRRWWVLLSVSGAAGAAALLGALIPALGGLFTAGLGRWPAWLVWSVAGGLSLLVVLWLSTWAQAAALEAACGEKEILPCLADAWTKTGPFAWILSLVLLATGGAYMLLLLPGLWLSPLLFWAPFIQMTEGVSGVEALEASWRRVSGRWWAVSGRLALAGLVPFFVGLVPLVGWLLGLIAGPFSLVMLADLSDELRRLDPGPGAPAPRLALPVAALSALFLLGSYVIIRAAVASAAALLPLISGASLI